MAFIGLGYLNVRTLDPSVCVEILAEIGARHGLVQLTLNERLIGPANPAISVGVAGEEAEGNISMGLSVAVDVLRMQSYNLCAGHTSELGRHAVAAKCNGSDGGC